ncbi:glycosyltransferase [Mucilaginibacter calamicampi]|uniref:Glycosyltransferase n=1 Tax=Mucilaginibacter calamicampi TaxID=1302352 RepID=A0ABW2YXK0_9SPHI
MLAKNRFNILIIPELLPYPPTEGGRLCIFVLIDYLRKFHDIQLLLAAYSKDDTRTIDQLRAEWPEVIIHVAELYTEPAPEKFRQKLKRRVLDSLKSIYYSRKKMGVATDVYSRYDPHFTLPFNPHHRDFISKLVSVLDQTKFDIIQTELTRMLNLVSLFPPASKKIFVQIESKSDILYDYGRSHGFDVNYIEHVAGNTAFIEYAYMAQYDAVFALNDLDARQIREHVPPSVAVYTSPFGLLDKDVAAADFADEKKEHLIFMGGEGHYPNYDGLYWFLSDVLKEIPDKPFKNIYITGNWSVATKAKFSQLSDQVNFIGFVDDLSPYLRSSICIVPIRIGGGGIRTKILSAMAQGSPVIATTLSSVGIKGDHGRELLIADTAENFAQAIIELFAKPPEAQAMARNAYRLLLAEYTQTAVGAKRNGFYQSICNPSAIS